MEYKRVIGGCNSGHLYGQYAIISTALLVDRIATNTMHKGRTLKQEQSWQ